MRTCFVVQGFGKKTDFTDGRVLDLDASYAIIKDAVTAAGFDCVRADEIPHSGTIDVPMYRKLYEADLVIADLSTYNVNAAFELGVRYGLKPRATIIIAEEQFKSPFDVTHIVIRRYKHLGEDIGVKEARRFREDLVQAIKEIMARGDIDSPVYTFLNELEPPRQKQLLMVGAAMPAPAPMPAAADIGSSAKASDTTVEPEMSDLAPAVPPAPAVSPKTALDEALRQIRAGNFAAAAAMLEEVRKQRPNDSFVIQQLALATYKSQLPTPEAALLAAKEILRPLSPASTNDPETLGLWAAIDKQLWKLNHDRADLDEAIDVCERGFRVKQDHYNGINLAHLLEQRALAALQAGERDEGMADAVLAKRVRRQVIQYAEPQLGKELDAEKRFWIVATLREAAVGLGDAAAAAKWEAEMKKLDAPAWMLDSSESQIKAVLESQAEIARLGSAGGN